MSSPFGTRKSTGVWCRIAGGKVVRNAEETTPGAVKVEKQKNGQGTGEYRWELHDDTIEGRIVGFERKTQTFNNEDSTTLIVRLFHKESGTMVNVQFGEGGRYWRALMYRLPNVDLSRDVVIAPYDFIPQGEAKAKIGLAVKQGAEKVPSRFSREDPGGMPEAVSVTYKGKDRLDFTKQDEWLNTVVLTPVSEKVAFTSNAAASAEPVGVEKDAAADEDDLPFWL